MDEVLRLRHRIDEIDHEIIQLLKSRYEDARLLGEIKKSRGLSLRDSRRESAVLQEMGRVAEDLDMKPALILPIFRRIFSLSVQAQRASPGKTAQGIGGLRVLVVGGTGGMGRFFAQFARLNGASVKIVGRESTRTRKTATEMQVQAGSMSDARTADIAIVATPMDSARRVALELAAEMKEGALLADLSSVKTGIADVIASKIRQRIEYVSLHPLFSPQLDHVHGQTILAVPFKTGPMWRRFSKALEQAGARLEICSVKAHDETMSYVQVIHHFSLIVFGSSMSRWNGRFKTNSLRSSEARIRSLLQNWRTIIGIQRRNPYAQSARREYVKMAERLEAMDSSDQSWARRVLESYVQKWSRKT